MDKYIVNNKRTITAEQQHTCDKCKESATTSCTDAIQDPTAPDGWRQSDPRYGCPHHEVKPNVILPDEIIPFLEYMNAHS